ncbi:Flagellum-specific ATP synthase FliI [Cronobacter universalis NCTC 9529]|nr:Flagellum-specific ATP synthase FliI [Cronobacter universalis NCTC 9529]
MTARLTRWLNTLDNFEAKMAQLPSVRRYGRLTRATGLVLEATGLQLPLGATCIIERQEGAQLQEVESEVVGFNGQKLFLMPLEEVEGILPGRARLCPRGSGRRVTEQQTAAARPATARPRAGRRGQTARRSALP